MLAQRELSMYMFNYFESVAKGRGGFNWLLLALQKILLWQVVPRRMFF